MPFTHYKLPTLLCVGLMSIATLQAQTVDDALIFSKSDEGTSARIKGLGGAQTALGGDISSINGNPAGLGFFSRSDISVTLNYLRNQNKINYGQNNSNTNKGNFGIDQAGVVLHFPTYNNYSGWKNFNVGVSYNKTQNFNNHRLYEGQNSSSSIVNALTDLMDKDITFEQDFMHSNIVDVFDKNTTGKDGFYSLADESYDKKQFNEHTIKGHRSQLATSFGANYGNVFYIGATLGISSFRYDKTTQFIENGWTKSVAQVTSSNPHSIYLNPDNLEYDYLNASYELFDNFSQISEGSGIDLKLGMIYKPAVDWNVGLTITTPTWTTIKEDTRAYTDIDFYDDETSDHPFPNNMQYGSKFYDSAVDYMLTTPWKFALGLTKFFGRGLLTADAELINYSSMRYSDLTDNYYKNDAFRSKNNEIKNTFQTTANIRIGGEYLFNNILSGRAGFSYFGNPYKYAEEKNIMGSLGLGVKLSSSLYLDAAVNHRMQSYKEVAYDFDKDFWNMNPPVADIKLNRTNFALTLGAKF